MFSGEERCSLGRWDLPWRGEVFSGGIRSSWERWVFLRKEDMFSGEVRLYRERQCLYVVLLLTKGSNLKSVWTHIDHSTIEVPRLRVSLWTRSKLWRRQPAASRHISPPSEERMSDVTRGGCYTAIRPGCGLQSESVEWRNVCIAEVGWTPGACGLSRGFAVPAVRPAVRQPQTQEMHCPAFIMFTRLSIMTNVFLLGHYCAAGESQCL